MINDRVEPVVVVLEVREDGEHHPGDTGLALAPPPVVKTPVALQPLVEEVAASRLRLAIARRQTQVAEQEHRVGCRGPLGMIEAVVRRLPGGPGAVRILLREQAGAPSVARDLLPLALDRRVCGADDVAQHLPANGRVAVEQPAGHGIAVVIHNRSRDRTYRPNGTTTTSSEETETRSSGQASNDTVARSGPAACTYRTLGPAPHPFVADRSSHSRQLSRSGSVAPAFDGQRLR